jgi:RsiW-degrading membrane proteinase PrsW (M82 family)
MDYLLLTLFGFLPSVIWLAFYLRKDAHPEPKSMVIKVFFFGMLIAFPTALIEIILFKCLDAFHFSLIFATGLNMFIAVALVEELMKYAVIKQKVIKNKEFDEPVDAMIYMIIVALGFAAVENLLILFPLSEFFEIFTISGIRALCSATIGYFIALWYFRKKPFRFVIFGALIAIISHGLYNFSVVTINNGFKFLIPAGILFCLAIFVSWAFLDLKRK